MKKKKYILFIGLLIQILIYSLFFFDKTKIKRVPKLIYMPDMYYTKAYEPYFYFFEKNKNKKIFNKKKFFNFKPVKKTIQKNKNNLISSIFKNSNSGFLMSKKINVTPLLHKESKKNRLNIGKEMYNIYCSICHGKNGNGHGFLVKNEKILGVPNYKDRDITIGSIYYVILYGKNIMGSYSSQINIEDRWRIAEYVMKLKKKLN